MSPSVAFRSPLYLALYLALSLGIANGQNFYTGPTTGNWDDGANWSDGSAPTAASNVVIDNRGQNSTVTIAGSLSRSVGDLTINGNDELVISNNSAFSVTGSSLNLDGTLTLNSLGNLTRLLIDNTTALTGDGSLILGGISNINRLEGLGMLTNSATIAGRGNIGTNTLSLVNSSEGLIHANLDSASGSSLFLDPGDNGGFTNQGIFRASNAASLILGGGEYQNNDGIIEALGEGSEVNLISGASITGGTLRTQDGGLIRGNASQSFFLRDVTLPTEAQFRTENNSTLNVDGEIDNSGTMTIFSAGNITDINLQGDTIFNNSGEIVLANSINARIRGSGHTLTNSTGHTIRGQGQVGLNNIGLINHGLVAADVAGKSLILNPSSALGFENNATFEALGGGILVMLGNLGGDFDNEGGVIRAVGANSEVQLRDGATISGGTISTQDGGLIRGNLSQSFSFVDVTLTEDSQFRAENNTDFNVRGTITNNGAMEIFSAGNLSDIQLLSNTTFEGSGEVVLSNSLNARIHGAGHVLTHSTDHTIRGQGQIGANDMGLINLGLIQADVTGQLLLMDPGADLGFKNNAIFEAVNGGILQLSGNLGGGFDNEGGVMRAVGENSEIQLVSGASITGGSMTTTDGGLIRGNTGRFFSFTDVTFTEGSEVLVENNSDFRITGTIENEGTITLSSAGNLTDVELRGDAALTGTGEIVLSGNPNARVHGEGSVLTNGAGHTIRGQGQIGANDMSLFNAPGAVVEADVDGQQLILDPVNGNGTFDNRGLFAASNGGTLTLSGSLGGSFDNTDGTIRAGDRSLVQLLNGTAIEGGLIESVGSGRVLLPLNQQASISDAVVTADLTVENNATLVLSGNIEHSGQLQLQSFGNLTTLQIDSILDLEGGGAVTMNHTNTRISGNGVLINRDHEISGIGNLGSNQAAITNTVNGTIHANSAGVLNIDPNSFLGFVNDGTMRASDGGTLNLQGTGGGQFTFGETSVIEVLDGGTFTHSGGAILTNLTEGILSDGIYRVIDSGNGAELSLPGGNITTNAANVELSGAGAGFAQLNTLEQNEGRLSLVQGAQLQVAGNFQQTSDGVVAVAIDAKPENTGLWGRFLTEGEAFLDGTLDVLFNLSESFTAAIGDTWKIVSSNTRSGEFSEVNVTAAGLPEDAELAVNYSEDGVEVEVVSQQAQRIEDEMTYFKWADSALTPGMSLNPAADDDGDGASNLQEYAFGMDPRRSDPWLLPKPSLMRIDGSSYLGIHANLPVAENVPNDLEYVIESSEDLANWQTADAIETIDESGLNARLVDSVGEGRVFLRIRIERR